jgi:uncharacterized membrane protein YgaE (UPF0421/DUF939 family)
MRKLEIELWYIGDSVWAKCMADDSADGLKRYSKILKAQLKEIEKKIKEFEEDEPEDEEDPSYEPEDEEESRLPLSEVYRRIEEGGNRSQRFKKILKETVRSYPDQTINKAYNRVLGTQRYKNPLKKKEDIVPNFWSALGKDEAEKIENAKKVMQYLYQM